MQIFYQPYLFFYLYTIWEPTILFMKIRKHRFRILCSKHNDLAMRKRHMHLPPIEKVVPDTIALCQTIEEPLGIKSWDVRRATGGDDDWGEGFNISTCVCLNDYLPHALSITILSAVELRQKRLYYVIQFFYIGQNIIIQVIFNSSIHGF